MIYPYKCIGCDYEFDIKKPLAEYARDERCPYCGQVADRVFTPLGSTFGWRLKEECHHIRGYPDIWERAI